MRTGRKGQILAGKLSGKGSANVETQGLLQPVFVLATTECKS